MLAGSLLLGAFISFAIPLLILTTYLEIQEIKNENEQSKLNKAKKNQMVKNKKKES